VASSACHQLDAESDVAGGTIYVHQIRAAGFEQIETIVVK
jgi:hypothetical protein